MLFQNPKTTFRLSLKRRMWNNELSIQLEKTNPASHSEQQKTLTN